jgi:cytochrome c nitrite reductase small subunit
VAACNDCHAPHAIVGKYVTKAVNGFWHSVAFTSGRFHEPIAITERNRRVTEGACRYCHDEIAHAIDTRPARGQEIECIRCHRSVGHLH